MCAWVVRNVGEMVFVTKWFGCVCVVVKVGRWIMMDNKGAGGRKVKFKKICEENEILLFRKEIRLLLCLSCSLVFFCVCVCSYKYIADR